MSRQVDERIVSMKFDNRQFESNVKDTMSTLDKLKQALSLKGSARAAESEFASYKSGFISLRDSINKMWASWEQDIALRMKRIAKSLTVEPLTTGFQEYETKINAIQTILANTESKGTTMSDVTAALDELNTYADKTIYNFSEMTRNIGTFTAAGVGLQDSVNAIQGIANLAAVSGSTAQQASTAMYQLSQALSSGKVRLMDWNSVVNAGMGGEVFQNALKETARVHGVAIDEIIKKNGSFRESLSEDWLTAEILTETLSNFTKYAEEGTEEWRKLKAELKGKGYTDDQAESILKMGKTATEAATKVKTFTQLMDTLKESIQSGWSKTWEILFGDFEEAKEMFSSISDKVGGFIERVSEARNSLLEGAFSSPWKQFDVELKNAGVSSEEFQNKLKEVAKENGYAVDELIKKHGSLAKAMSKGEIPTKLVTETLKKMAGAGKDATKSTENMTDKLEYFQKVVDKVWHGDYANGEARIAALTKAGYNYSEVQALVNKTVDGHKLTLEDLSDAQLKSVGYTDEQIKSIRELAEEAETAGKPLNELIARMEKPSGRELLIESFGNALQGLGAIIGSVGKAWKDIFSPEDTQTKASNLYKFLEALRDFTKHLRVSEEDAEKLRKTFQGVFAVLDIVFTLIAGPFKIAFKLLKAILEECDLSILDVTAAIGQALVKFRDWVDRTIDFSKAAEKIVPPIRDAMKAFSEWVKTLKQSDNIPRDIAKGLVKGIKGCFQMIVGVAKGLGEWIIETVKNVLGIHSPSTEFFEIGKNTVLGFIEGFKYFIGDAADAVADGFEVIKDYVSDIDWGMVFVAGMSAGTLLIVKKIVDAITAITSPIGGIADGLAGMFQGLESSLKGVGKWFKAKAFESMGKALINFAIAIGILVAAIIALTLVDDSGKLVTATVIVGALIGAMAVLMVAMTKFIKEINAFNSNKDIKGALTGSVNLLSIAILISSIAFSVLAIAGAIALLGSISTHTLVQGSIALGVIVGVMVGIMASTKLLSQSIKGKDFKIGTPLAEFGKMMKKIAWSLILIGIAIKIFGKMKTNELIQGGFVFLAILGTMVGIMAATRLLMKSSRTSNSKTKETSGAWTPIEEFGKMFKRIAWSLILFAVAIKVFGSMPTDELIRGGLAVELIIVTMVGIMAATRLLGKNYKKKDAQISNAIEEFGKMFKKIAWSLILIAVAIKLLGAMRPDELIQGLLIVEILVATMVALMAATKLLTKDANKMGNVSKIGTMFLGVSAGILLIAIAMRFFAKMDGGELAKGGAVVLVILGAMVGIMAATKLLSSKAGTMKHLNKVGKMMIGLAAAIGILSLAMYVMGKINPDRLGPALASIVTIMAGLVGIMAATKLLSNTKGSQKTLTMCVVAVAVLIGGLVALSFVNQDQLAGATLAVIGVMGALAALIAATSLMSKLGGKTAPAKTLTRLIVALGIIIVGLVALSFTNPERLSAATKAVTAAVLALSVLVAATSLLSKFNKALSVKDMLKTIAAMLLIMVPLGVLMGAVILLTKNDIDANAVLMMTTSLTIALLGLTGVAAVMGVIGKMPLKNLSKGALVLAMMAGVAELVALVLWHMQSMNGGSGLTNAMEHAQALILVMGAFVIIGALAGAIGCIPLPILATGALVLAMMAGIAELVALVLWHMESMNGGNGLTNGPKHAAILIVVMTAFLAIGAIAGAIGCIPLRKLSKGALVLAMMVGIAEFVALVLWSMEGMNLTNAVDNALALTAVLIGLAAAGAAAALLGVVGVKALLGFGIMAGMAAGIPALGKALSAFSNELTNGGFDKELVVGAIEAFAAMALAAKDMPASGGLWQKIVGEKDLGEFGSQLPKMGKYLCGFTSALSEGGFTGETAELAKSAVRLISDIAEIAQDIPKEGGWMEAITGSGNIGTFGEYFGGLGANLAAFTTNLVDGGFTKETSEIAKTAVKVIASMAEAAKDMPKEGGWLQAIVGNGTIATFGDHLPGLGSNLGMFVQNLLTNGFTKDSASLAKDAAKALADMAEAADKMPVDGGWLQAITGSGSIETFGKHLPSVGENLAKFVNFLVEGNISSESVSIAKSGAEILEVLAETADKMPVEGAWWQKLIGEKQSLEEFGKQLPVLGSSLKAFVENLGTFNEDSLTTIELGIKAVNAFAALSDTDLKATTKQLSGFGEELVAFATPIKSFATNMSNVDGDNLNNAIANVNKLLEMLDNIEGVGSDKIRKFVESLKELGKTSVTAFIEEYKGSADQVKEAAIGMINNIIAGASEQSKVANENFKTIAENAAEAVEDKYDNFKDAGEYLVEGFCKGISENTWRAEAEAAAMAGAADESARNRLGINSPSKAFREIGMGVPEGFAQGIDRYSKLAVSSTESMGDAAIDGIRNSIRDISKLVSSDLDSQPTIRPVLDLTDVQYGARSIGSMFGSGVSVGMLADLGGIGYSMSHKNQNGNGDVVSAINQLRDDLGNMDRASYNINGVTYAAGSDVAEAIAVLVRAAIIKGRT